MYKYICDKCSAKFDEPADLKKIASLLVRSSFLVCPYCRCNNIRLTDHGKLLIERRAKIQKIENDTRGIPKTTD